jgi:hypothetical protein
LVTHYAHDVPAGRFCFQISKVSHSILLVKITQFSFEDDILSQFLFIALVANGKFYGEVMLPISERSGNINDVLESLNFFFIRDVSFQT